MARHYKKMNKRVALVLLSLCAVLCLALGTAQGVWAYLISQTREIPNTFVPATVTCMVEEQFQNGVKEQVKVRNTGNIAAYIRATVVATYVAPDGKVLATAPQEGVDYTVQINDADWKRGSDGFWYYPASVAPNGLTADLIHTAEAVTAPDGYRLNLQILATAIQAEPPAAAEQAWGVTVTDGTVSLQ